MNKVLTSLLSAALLSTSAAHPAAAQHLSRTLRTAEYRALQQKLCRGWNTWSANSVLAHVYLPDGFALTLGLKSAGMGHSYQNTFFQANATVRRLEKNPPGPARRRRFVYRTHDGVEHGRRRFQERGAGPKRYGERRRIHSGRRAETALSENLTDRPLLRNFLHPLNREELDVGYGHPLGLQ